MAKIKCPCGNKLDDSYSPHPDQGHVVTDKKFGEMGSQLDIVDDYIETWECPECGRLGFLLEYNPTWLVKWYKPEDGKRGHIMSGNHKCYDGRK